jgi:hypothetical protein
MRQHRYIAMSDDQLNRMWYSGAYTAQMDMVPIGVASCFTHPVIFDGAKRDRAIWSGDLMVTDPVTLLSIGSNRFASIKGSIDSIMNLQASSGRLTSSVGFRGGGAFDFATTYSAYSAIIAIQYYRYSGDTAYVRSLLPKLEAATAFHATRVDANGLVVTSDPDYCPGDRSRGRCQPRQVESSRVFITTLRKDDMQGSERDPETIVRRLMQSEIHLSARARDEVLALGIQAVPALLRILDDGVLEKRR